MKRTKQYMPEKYFGNLYSLLSQFTEIYDDAESECAVVLKAIETAYQKEYGASELESASFLSNMRNAGRKSKLSSEDLQGILQMRRAKKPIKEIADYYHVSERYIYKIIHDQ